MIEAVKSGDIDAVKWLIAVGADVNATDNVGNTALISAAAEGYSAIVEMLLKAGADVDAQTLHGYRGWSALMYAAREGHADIVRLLLDAGADVNATLFSGTTALMDAASGGYPDIVRLLLAQPDIDVNAQDNNGGTALMAAGEGDVVRLLLAAGADVNAQASDGETALFGPVRGLIELRQTVNEEIDRNLYRTARVVELVREARIYIIRLTEVVRQLLAAGADVDATNDDGDTVFMIAEQAGRIDIVRTINSFLAEQAMNRWIPRHRSRQRDRLGLSELDRGTPFMDLVYYHTQGFL